MIQGVGHLSQLLAEMDRMKVGAGASAVAPSATQAPAGADFTQVFKAAIGHVNELQQRSESMQKAFEMGDSKVDLTQVMVALQKANLSLEGMIQVRNKFINAYKEIMSMSI